MRFFVVSLIVLAGLDVSRAEAPPWAEKPRIITTLDMEAAFRAQPLSEKREVNRAFESTLYLKLCAKSEGKKGSTSYNHLVTVSIEKASESSEACKSYPVVYYGREGAYPEYHLILRRNARMIPARRIYLLSDDFRWFLYLSGSSPGDIFEYHDAEVIRIELWDKSEAGSAPLDVGFATKCRGHVADHDSDCYDCQVWENQGRPLEELRDMYDGIFKCIREKLLDSGPRIIHWSKSNSQCFIDYSMCVR